MPGNYVHQTIVDAMRRVALTGLQWADAEDAAAKLSASKGAPDKEREAALAACWKAHAEYGAALEALKSAEAKLKQGV